MDSIYRPASGDDMGECLNMLPLKHGTLRPISPDKNAVIVQLFSAGDEVRTVISIECMDEHLYAELQNMALAILDNH